MQGNKFKIAVDVDGVLVLIAERWIERCLGDPILKDAVSDTLNRKMAELSIRSPEWRTEYYLDTWMDVKEPKLRKRFLELYLDDIKFYDDLPPTKYFRSLRSISHMIDQVHVVTQAIDPNCRGNISKKRFLAKAFRELDFPSDVSLDFYFLSAGEKKSDVLKDLEWGTFVEDHIENIVDVVENASSNGRKEFLIPAFGYNSRIPKRAEYEILNGHVFQHFGNM